MLARVSSLVLLLLSGLLFACGESAGSAVGCDDVESPEAFVGQLRDLAAAADLKVTPLGATEPCGGCDRSTANIEQVGSDVFLVALDVTAVVESEGASLLRDHVSEWEQITDNPTRNARAVEVVSAMSGSDGLGKAVVDGRCSETEPTCRYWIAVDGWLLDAQLLYLGTLDRYDADVSLGDALIVGVGEQLGRVVGAS